MTGPERAAVEQQRHQRPGEAPGGEPEALRVRLLGGFEVSVGPQSIGEEGWHLKKAGSLIKLLALAPGHRLHREQVVELLWPGLGSEAAANNLHYALHVARRALDPLAPANNAASRYLALRGDLLALGPDGPLWVDVEAFKDAATTARRSREPAAYWAAIELYVGDLLPEDLYEPWAEEKRERLMRSYHALLLELATLYEERGEYGPAIEALRRVAAEEPIQEEAHVGLMRLYALSGRHREAILRYERLRKALRKEFDEEPNEASRRLYEEIRAGKFPPAPPSPATGRPSGELSDSSPNNLPASLTSFVGREDASLEVKRLLAMTRLLTLTGVGGSGKTRLALEVARDRVGAYPDGVWLVELALLSEPALAPQTVAQALGVREQPGRSVEDTLTDHLRTKDLLLVVDNCEHLVEAVARLAQALLRSCPKLRLLATSREPLGVPGEALWTVPPLSLPDAQGASSIGSLMSAEAVRLFLDRTRSRLPGFELTEENAAAVMRVCRKLEGIPLAIELAAARMGALAVEQVAQRLEDSLKLLTHGVRTSEPRQQTLRATLDWSHELLSEPERKLFGHLSVFAGGWTLDAAEAVGTGNGIERDDVLNLLSKLVDKSLVVAEASPGAGEELRYRMLEPVRQYGQERLEESGEAERVRKRHAEYYLALVEEADAREPGLDLIGSRPVAWIKRMEAEHGNLRAALSWALDLEEAGEYKEELGLRLAVALTWFWHTRDYQSEGRRYLERAVSRRSNRTTTRLRARALILAGWMDLTQADFEAAKALMEEGLALCRELGDEEGIASGLTELGYVAVLGQRDDILMPAVIEELMELKPRVRNRNTLARLLVLEGVIAASRGDLERSATLHEESLQLFREIRNLQGIITCLDHLGFIALLKANYEGAASLLREGLRLARESDYNMHIQICLYGLGCVAACQEDQPVRAVRLWGAVEGIQEAYGIHLTPITRSITNYEGCLADARSQLGEEEAFAAAWAEGKAMPLERAVEYALLEEEEEREPPTTLVPVPEQRTAADEPTERLTSREREIALLVARGLTNRRIASELSISERTVENHVRKILKKLGFPSRARIAAWVAQR